VQAKRSRDEGAEAAALDRQVAALFAMTTESIEELLARFTAEVEADAPAA